MESRLADYLCLEAAALVLLGTVAVVVEETYEAIDTVLPQDDEILGENPTI